MSDIGSFILRVLRQRKKSLRQLSREAGVSNSYLSQLTRGLFVPSAEILLKLAPHLAVAPSRLFAEAGWLSPKRAEPEERLTELRFSVPVAFFRGAAGFIAYTPALDFSTSGDTLEEAKRMFFEGVTMLFEDLVEMGTLNHVLKECGWKRVTGPNGRWEWLGSKEAFEPKERQIVLRTEEDITVAVPICA